MGEGLGGLFGRCAALAVIGAALVGCPSPQQPDAGVLPDAGPAVTFDDLDRALHDLRCARSIRCEAVSRPEGACHPAASRRRDAGFGLRERICEGFALNPFAAQRCIEAAAEQTCDADDWDEDLWSCLDIIGRAAPFGSTCEPWSCGEDAYCGAGPECPGGGCPWRCHARGGDGEICGASGFMREPSIDCDPEHECVRPPGETPRCRPRTHPGDACDATGCTYPQECREGVCVGRREQIGDDCELVGCAGELQCVRGMDGRATCQTGGEAGDVCGAFPWCQTFPGCTEPPPCAAGHRCADGICVALVAPGATCSESAACPALFHCGAGRCVPDGVPGEACSDAAPCAVGACVDGTCTLLEPGAACTPSIGEFTDELGPCRVGACVDGVCPIVVPLGETCPTSETSRTHACDQNADCHPSTGTCELLDPGYVCM